MSELINKIVKVDNNNLGYEIHTNEQLITVFIDNNAGCCESWGFITTEDKIEDFIGTELVSLAVVDIDYKQHPLTKDF